MRFTFEHLKSEELTFNVYSASTVGVPKFAKQKTSNAHNNTKRAFEVTKVVKKFRFILKRKPIDNDNEG